MKDFSIGLTFFPVLLPEYVLHGTGNPKNGTRNSGQYEDDTIITTLVTGGLAYGWNNIPDTWIAACPGAIILKNLPNG